MQNITTLLFIFFFGCCFAQHSGKGACALKPDNKAWLAQFKKTDLGPEKVDLVINKIFSDTDYFVENPEIANLEDRRVFGNIPCTTKCSIRFGVVYGKNKGITIDLQRNPEWEALLTEFNSDNIDRIELNEHHAKDKYKTAGIKRSGVIIYTDDKDLKKKIKRAIKEMAKS